MTLVVRDAVPDDLEARMKITLPSIGELVTRLVDGQKQILGIDLIGSYLFGSVVTGDFEGPPRARPRPNAPSVRLG
jgi:hypothetical protein